MKQILCFGDSNTYGLIPGENGRYEWGVRWTSLLDEYVGRWNYRVVEEGLCGRTTMFDDIARKGRRGTELLPVLLETHGPLDIIVVMLGTNDCKTAYKTDAEKIGEGVEQILDQIKEAQPQAQVILVSPIALGEGVWEEGFDIDFDAHSVRVSKELPQVYERIAARRKVEFLRASDYGRPSDVDREHMNAESHSRFAEGICAKIQEVILRQQLPYYKDIAS